MDNEVMELIDARELANKKIQDEVEKNLDKTDFSKSKQVDREAKILADQIANDQYKKEAQNKKDKWNIDTDILTEKTAKKVNKYYLKSQKEQAYFDRHKSTLDDYGIYSVCDWLKMFWYVALDFILSLLISPFVGILKASTVVFDLFNKLLPQVQKTLKMLFWVIVVGVILYTLNSKGIIAIG